MKKIATRIVASAAVLILFGGMAGSIYTGLHGFSALTSLI